MGHRLSRITTRTGDLGTTGLATGVRISKSHLRIQVIGEVDELNSYIGYLLTFTLPKAIHMLFIDIQHQLFELGAELCSPCQVRISNAMIVQLEEISTTINAELEPLKEFILPGGAPAASVLHIVRTVCRRAERSLVALQEVEPTVTPLSLIYLNRLSDVCFILTRYLNKCAGISEMSWTPLLSEHRKKGE